VIFTSDNGGEKFSDMGPFNGKKLLLWEGGIRVPAFVKWPGKIKPGSTTDQPAITMDWTATILAAAKVKDKSQKSLDGTNLLPLCTQKAKPFERTLYWRTIERSHHKAMREGNWKYFNDGKDEYLFDLSADPSEKNNLREKNRETFDRLKSKYATWEASVLKADTN
jgi:arylsulfatase A-like enzyme